MSFQEHSQPLLLVEDSPEDRETTIRAFRKSGVKNKIYICEDGEEALDYLHRREQFADPKTSPRPGVILLDLNLPGTGGKDVLEEVKADPDLKNIPVIVLTTSSAPRDVEACYAAGANTYLQKPVDLAKFVEAIERLKEYWFEFSILPKNGG